MLTDIKRLKLTAYNLVVSNDYEVEGLFQIVEVLLKKKMYLTKCFLGSRDGRSTVLECNCIR